MSSQEPLRRRISSTSKLTNTKRPSHGNHAHAHGHGHGHDHDHDHHHGGIFHSHAHDHSEGAEQIMQAFSKGQLDRGTRITLLGESIDCLNGVFCADSWIRSGK